jgi:hypothetical protein
MLCQLSDCGKQPKYEGISCLTRVWEREREIERERRYKNKVILGVNREKKWSRKSDISVL